LSCTKIGIILATIVCVIVLSPALKGTIFGSWRIPFFLGGIISFGALYMRFSLKESNIFHGVKKESNLVSYPFFYLIFFNFKSLLKGTGLGFFIISMLFFYALLPEILYLFYDFNKLFVFFIVNVSCIVSITVTVLSGYIIDKYKLQKIYFFPTGCILMILMTPVISYLIFYSNNVAFVSAYIILGILNGISCSSYFSLTTELFEPYIRFTGISVSFTAAVIFGGSAIPFVADSLISKTNPAYVVAVTVIIAMIISLIAAWWIYFSSNKYKTGKNEII
jgi:MFS transporter, MHS family, shikimate and dehydroshikimate transport protein